MGKKILLLAFLLGSVFSLQSQCFQIMDGNGNPSTTPYFINCAPGSYTIFIQPNQALGPYTINWGDGSPNTTGSALVPPNFESHTYAATTDTFNLTVTAGPCTVNGVVVQERNPLASIQLPSGDDNFGCTPIAFRYVNSSTQVSQTTEFVWDFGDGSPIEQYDYTNLGDTLTHTYLPGIGVQSCDLEVTLTASNYCGTSTASFFPVKVWDLDEAQITPSAYLFCYPDTIVSYVNSTIRNCYPEGNQSQRYEYWNFGDYWGKGYDSIIQWRPWNPPIINPPPIAYPGVGTYNVTLLDSSYCGIDDVTIQITITDPPTAGISANKDSICAGETVRFFSNSSGGANIYSWNFDQGNGWENLSGGTKNRIFNTPRNYTIRLAVGITGTTGCFDTASVDLVVNPGPITNFTTDPDESCDSLTTNITNTTTGSANFYRWDFGNGNSFIGQNPPDQSYNSPGSYTIQLYAESSTACKDSITRDVVVRESPSADFSVTSVCVDQQAVFTDLSTDGSENITSWKWYFGDGDSSNVQNPSHAYTSFGSFNVILIVSDGFCSDTLMMPVVVESPPTANFVPDTTEGCSQLTINFTNTSTPNATSFQWNFGDGSAVNTNQHPTHSFSNTGDNDTTFIVQLIAETTFGCADTTSDTITVFPVPQPRFTSNAMLECGPITVDFTNLTHGDSLNYIWNFGDGSPLVTDTNPTHIFENKTLFISNYNVSLIVFSKNGCTDTTTQIVTVYPEPNFNFSTSPDSGCSPLAVNFPSVVGAVNYQWDFGDGNVGSGPSPNHTYINNTTNDLTFTIQLIAQSSFGCVDTSYGSVLVYPNPVANFLTDTNKGCQPLPIIITNTTTGANNYHWTFGDGSSSNSALASFMHTYTNTSQLTLFNTIQLIAETDKGCKDTAESTIEVHPFIDAMFSSDTAGCSPFKVGFNNQSIGATSYQWEYGDGAFSVQTNPQHTFNNNTSSDQIFQTKLMAVSPQGCLDSTTRNILVYPKPTADFLPDVIEGCQPLNVVFTNNSSLSDSCSWRFGNGSTAIGCNPLYTSTYANTTSFFPIDYVAELRVFTDNGCSDTIKQNINVKPAVNADFIVDTVGCSPFKANFQNQSNGGITNEWTFGDGGGQPAFHPSHFYINSGYTDTTFTSTLIVTSSYNCKDTATKNITVLPKPLADFNADVLAGCQPLPVNFTNNSIIADSCRWSFGDGSFLNDCFTPVLHTYTNTVSLVPMNYKAELMVYTDEGCADSLSTNINVSPQVIADFSMDTVGCSPLPTTLRSQSFGAINYSWNFGDGSIGNGMIANHTFLNTGSMDSIFQVQLIAQSLYSCNDTAYQDVLVRPTPIPNFFANPPVQTYPNATVTLNNQSNPGNWNFKWDFKDSTFSTLRDPGTHTYNRWGKYLIKLKASTNFCADSVEKLVEIKVPVPIADFKDSASGCAPLTVNFQNLSQYGRAYEWEFGDGGSSSLENPTYTYYQAGDYSVSLKVYGYETGKEDYTLKPFYIHVHETPVAGFFLNKEKVFVPNDPLVLTNTSRYADNYMWDFGDGNSSSQDNPVHFYQEKGEYFISLIASANNGCVDTFYLNIPVVAEGVGSLQVPNAFTPNPHGSNGGIVHRNASIDIMNDVFYAKIKGAVKYELNIFNKWGELLFVSEDVNIGWDGYYRGELCQQDAYVWKIRAEFVDGTSVVKVGDLLLLR